MGRLGRRRFLIATGAILAAPFPAKAQQPGRTIRVGALLSGVSDAMGPYRDAIRERFAAHGFVEGRNLRIDYRAPHGARKEDREIARELVATRPDALLAFSTQSTLALRWATTSIPIVFTHVSDPVADGIVADYANPGGNATGVATRHRELLAKRFELLRELLPRAKRVAFIAPKDVFESRDLVQQTANRLGFELVAWENVTAYAGALRAAVEARAEAMFVFSPHTVFGERLTAESLIDFANKQRIASIFPDAGAVALGGLISYGTDPLEDTRRAVDQLVRVLRGAKPGTLAVDQSSRFELVVNLKTARALGVTVPRSILLRADRVIE